MDEDPIHQDRQFAFSLFQLMGDLAAFSVASQGFVPESLLMVEGS